ncbi:MAG: hypothetical protein IPO93_10465 [Actinobacteria bacterium]|jgi:hypothetical protein|nr:hypothetical protein [Actinomycetota bacterium]
MADSERADWQGVGASFRTLGNLLKQHAVETGEAVRASGGQAEKNVVDDVTAGFKTVLAKFDEATTDPETSAAAKDATAKFLDAIKAELTGGGTTPEAPPAEPKADEPPKPIEP